MKPKHTIKKKNKGLGKPKQFDFDLPHEAAAGGRQMWHVAVQSCFRRSCPLGGEKAISQRIFHPQTLHFTSPKCPENGQSCSNQSNFVALTINMGSEMFRKELQTFPCDQSL